MREREGASSSRPLRHAGRQKTHFPRRFGFLYENVVGGRGLGSLGRPARPRLGQPAQAVVDVCGLELRTDALTGSQPPTSAMDANGRPAPSQPGTMACGVEAVRSLALPRQDDTGRLLIPPLKVKEQLHDIPADYTAVDGLDDRTLLGKMGGIGDCSPS